MADIELELNGSRKEEAASMKTDKMQKGGEEGEGR